MLSKSALLLVLTPFDYIIFEKSIKYNEQDMTICLTTNFQKWLKKFVSNESLQFQKKGEELPFVNFN